MVISTISIKLVLVQSTISHRNGSKKLVIVKSTISAYLGGKISPTPTNPKIFFNPFPF